MKKEVKIPDIAENVETGIVSNVLVSEGDEVDIEQALVEVETDKATTDIPSPFKGKILEIKVSQGEEVKVNQVIMLIEVQDGKEEKSEGEIKETIKENIEAKSNEKETKEERLTSEEKRELVKDEVKEKKEEEGYIDEKPKPEAKESTKIPENYGPDIPASPSVRRLARESDIELSQVKGTGPGGRITIEDIKKFAVELQKPEKIQSKIETELPDFKTWGDVERKPMSRVRILTAQNTHQAWSSIPHVTQFEKADITNLEEFRKHNSKGVENAGGKLTMTAILVKLSSMALEQFPIFNTSIDLRNEEIIFKKYINIGIAVDTERGLLVPVIRNANTKTLTQLAVEIGELADKARNKKINAAEMQGGTFTVSNLGGIAGTYFTPIVNTTEVAILGISQANTEPVWNGSEFKPRLLLPISLSYDHRIIDGADGARFIGWIKKTIENPFSLLL